MSDPEPGVMALTIDELAAASQVPSRTIRFYQSRGALMAPELRGRVAYYGPLHLERLKLIAQLQERGLRIDAIGDLVLRIDRGELDLAAWLGIEQQVQAPWANDQARTVSEAALFELAGSRRPGLVADLLRVRLVQRDGDEYLVESPALLGVAMKLEAVGIDLDTSAAASAIVRKHVGRAATELVELFVRRAREGFVETTDPAKLFTALRPTGIETVRVIFGRQMEQALRKLLESGQLAKLPSIPRKPKRR